MWVVSIQLYRPCTSVTITKKMMSVIKWWSFPDLLRLLIMRTLPLLILHIYSFRIFIIREDQDKFCLGLPPPAGPVLIFYPPSDHLDTDVSCGLPAPTIPLMYRPISPPDTNNQPPAGQIKQSSQFSLINLLPFLLFLNRPVWKCLFNIYMDNDGQK